MAYMNKIMLIGNVGKDAEIRTTPSGKKKASFSLATTEHYKDASNEKKERTEWHNIVAWGKLADIIERLQIKKGLSVFIEGKSTQRSWDDPNGGGKKYIPEVEAREFQILTPRSATAGQQPQGQGQASSDNNQQCGDEDLPF